jgi:hypothetical protein
MLYIWKDYKSIKIIINLIFLKIVMPLITNTLFKHNNNKTPQLTIKKEVKVYWLNSIGE